ncbi:MAG: UDP-N-acetylglucosamine 2-epimerase [Nitrosopumilaceae archaeon]
MNFKDVYPIIKEKKPKIVTFDYKSHKLFEQKKIQHEVSDVYITQNDLEHIQGESYSFAHWFDKPEISNLLQYDGINIGELFYYDFHYKLVPFLKKFYEIMKLYESNKNSTYVSSFLLYEIIRSFTTSVIKLKINNVDSENHNNTIKLPIKLGKFSHSIKLKYNYFQKLKNTYEKLFLYLLFTKNPHLKKGNTVLFIDFTTRKYRHIISILHKSSINLVKFDRIIPAVWNLESYSIIKKSNCLVENYTSLIDKSLKNSIESGISLFKYKTNLLWQQNKFFESFFSLNDKSFWNIIKPTLVKQYEQNVSYAVQEIELTKNLFKKYNFDSILTWSETNINHLIAIKLAKKQNIPVYVIQHGLYFDNVEINNFNKFGRVIPQYADKFLVWGNLLKQYAIRLGFPENNIEVIGSPFYDSIFVTKNKSILHQDEFILLATSSPFQNLVQDLTVEVLQNYSESIKKICEVISMLGKKLIIKLHPHPDEFDITDLAKKIDPRIIVIRAGDIIPLIKSCEVFITTDISTTILEAQTLEKPVISFKIRNHVGIPEVIKSNSCVCTTIDDFEAILTRILTDKKFKQEVIDRGTVFTKSYLSNIGTASKNLLHFLEKTDIAKDRNSLKP